MLADIYQPVQLLPDMQGRQALLDTLALEQERKRLHEANAAMRAQLSRLLNGATLRPTALDGPETGLLHIMSW